MSIGTTVQESVGTTSALAITAIQNQYNNQHFALDCSNKLCSNIVSNETLFWSRSECPQGPNKKGDNNFDSYLK